MSPTVIALLGFAAWSVFLVLCVGLYRIVRVSIEKRAPNSFSASGEDLPRFGRRLTRAHANTYEFLPVAGAVMLCALATGQSSVTDGLAYAFLGARLAQSVTHLLSTSNSAVLIRFVFFAAQVLIVIWWIIGLVTALS
jgi:uncharacterized MAPEG superfamily protein